MMELEGIPFSSKSITAAILTIMNSSIISAQLDLAIKNNIDVYKTIFDANNIKYNENNTVFYTLETPPPYYSNMITRNPEWKPDDTFSKVDRSMELNDWTIKDSFDCLQLEHHFFTSLFRAKWIYLHASNYKPVKASEDIQFRVISHENELNEWKEKWESKKIADKIFKTSLLSHENCYFIAGYKQNVLVSGCFLNKTETVMGISNFFCVDNSIEHWSGIIEFIYKMVGSIDLVGYERSDFFSELVEIGFEAIGNLNIWIRNRTSEAYV